MANVKITELTNLTDPSTTDVMPVVDVDADVTKKVSVGEVVGKISGDVDVATDGTSSIAAGVIVDADINANAEIAVSKLADGTARQLLQTDAAGTGVEWTDNVDLPGTLDVTGATTLASAAVSDLTEDRVVIAGASGELEDSANLTFDGSELGVTGTLDVSSDATVGGDLTVTGDLTVEGATTTLETQTVTVEDKNIELGVVDTPTDTTADGGGITLKGATDKTINWVNATNAWTSSEHIELASGKEFYIDGNGVLNATTLGSGVVNSSLTSVGTIATGTWEGDVIDAAYLDATVVTTSDTGTVTSTMISDGTIVNDDVNASAAIAGTKIDPDFGSQTVETTGVFSAAGGAEATPSIAFTGDLNTGIYSPGADQVAISTNGDERLRIDGAGRVLVGETGNTGANVKAVFGDGQVTTNGVVVINTEDEDVNGLVISNWTGSGTSYGPKISFSNSTRGTFSIGCLDGSDGFLIRDVSSATDRLVIDSSGRLGLGSSTPDALLTVNGISSFGAGAVGTPSIARSGDLDTGFWFPAANTLAASTAGTERIRVDGSGNVNVDNGTFYVDAVNNRVSIGTTSVGTKLVVAGNNSGGGNDNTLRFVDLDTSSANGQSMGRIEWYASDTDEPGVKAFIEATTYVDARGGTLTLGTDGSASGAQNIIFEQKNNEIARFDASGRLLVGTSTARDNIYISASAVTPSFQLEGSTFQTAAFSIVRTANDPSYIYLNSGSSGSNATGSLGVLVFNGYDGTNYRTAATISAEVDGTPGANDMPGRLVFSVTADGASSPTEALRISNDRSITVSDGGDVVLGTTTGTKIGTATSQKIGFYNATPVVQPTTGVAEAAFVENSGGTAVNVDSTFGGYTIQQVVEALQTLGLLA